MFVAYWFLLIPILFAAVIFSAWFVLLLAIHSTEAFRRAPHREFLGPGGPDDPFTVRVVREVDDQLPRRRERARTVSVERQRDGQQPARRRVQTGLRSAAS
jgi:hypothetical protein